MEYCKNLLLKRIEVIMTNIILAPCQSSMQRMMWWHCWLSWQKRSGLDQGDPGGTKMQIRPILFENWVCCQISKLGLKTALFSRLLFEETLNMEPDSQASTQKTILLYLHFSQSSFASFCHSGFYHHIIFLIMSRKMSEPRY